MAETAPTARAPSGAHAICLPVGRIEIFRRLDAVEDQCLHVERVRLAGVASASRVGWC